MSAEILAGIEQLKRITEEYQGSSLQTRESVVEGLSKIESRVGLEARLIYYDSQFGDDDNDGLNIENAIRSWQKVTELYQLHGRVVLRLLSECVADYYHDVVRQPGTLLVQGRNREGGFQAQELRFVDAVNSASRVGGFACYGPLTLNLFRVNLVMDYTRDENPIRSIDSLVEIGVTQCNLSRTGPSSAALITGERVSMKRSSTIFEPGTEGRIIQGVPAGANPNDYPFIETNFTQG